MISLFMILFLFPFGFCVIISFCIPKYLVIKCVLVLYCQEKDGQKDLSVPGAGVSSCYFKACLQSFLCYTY